MVRRQQLWLQRSFGNTYPVQALAQVLGPELVRELAQAEAAAGLLARAQGPVLVQEPAAGVAQQNHESGWLALRAG